jgi:hypothetical protein
MTNSDLTGNFDLCVEVTESILSAFLNSTFGGTRQQGQFTNVAVDDHAISGLATLGIDTAGIKVDPAHSPGGLVDITFSDSAIAFTAPVAADAAPLAGSVNASAPFKLPPPASNSTSLELDFTDPSASATVTLNAASLANVQGALAKVGLTGIPPAQLQTFLNQAMKATLAATVGAAKVNAGFTVVPGQDGTFGPPPKFPAMPQLVTRPAAGGAPGVLCGLGTILQSDVPNDNAANKTVTATDSVHQLSLTVSPAAVQGLLVKEAAGQLPAGLTLTATLLSGTIQIHVGGSISGTGYSADVTVDAHVTLSVPGGVLTPQVTIDQQSVNVSLDWWVWLLGGVIIPAIVDAIANLAANQLLQGWLSKLVVQANGYGVPTAGLLPFTFNAVDIQPQGIIIQALVPVATPSDSTFVQGMVTDLKTEAPVAGATVIINPDGATGGALGSGLYAEVSTDQNGMYSFGTGELDVFANDPNGPYPITAAQSDYFTGTETVTLEWGKTVTQDFALQPVLPITVKGQVLGSGAPVNGATVAIAYPPQEPGEAPEGVASTNAQPGGSYDITFNPGQYIYSYLGTATAPGFTALQVQISPIPNGGTVTQNFDLVAPHPFAIVGQVTGDFAPLDDPGDVNVSPVVGATVSAFPTVQQSPPLATYTTQTTTGGNYSVTGVDPGTYTGDYTVSVEAKLLQAQKADVMQPAGASVTQDFELAQLPSKVPSHPPKPGTLS